MPRKIRKDKIEFYINNTCNFNCDNCNRLNNYQFAGYDRWQDYENIYQAWSKKIDFGIISILGGEPLLNPTLDQWILGIRKFWPSSELQLLSNGSRLKHWHQRGLFEILSDTRTILQINLHNRTRIDAFLEEIKGYLRDPKIDTEPQVPWIDSYNQVKDPTWPDCKNYQDFLNLPEWIQHECTHIHGINWDTWVKNSGVHIITDRQNSGIYIRLNYYEDFVTAPLRYTGNHQFAVYNSDPDDAHRVCWSKNCTHMIAGKMYKCHHVALLPEFAKQYDVVMTPEDKQLLAAYVPLEVGSDLDAMQRFVKNLADTIPQCKLCPSKLEKISLQAGTTKPKVKKIVPILSTSRT